MRRWFASPVLYSLDSLSMAGKANWEAAMTIYHLDPTTGKRRDAWRNDKGAFVLGDPQHGKDQHKVANEVYAATEAEAVELIETKGHYIRVENAGTRESLMRLNLFVDGRRIT
jgi:hypothetical protein